jgi:hypothetical protein
VQYSYVNVNVLTNQRLFEPHSKRCVDKPTKKIDMKFVLFAVIFFTTFISQSQNFFDDADNFFSKNVKEGKVNYAGIKKQPQELNSLVKQIAEMSLTNKRVTGDYVKSFYINAYNILVIKQVVDAYPVYGPLKVKDFFGGIKHTVMGQQMTLDQLEKGTLYKQFPDARLHFVLVCAAKGCPPLASVAYKPENLEDQLSKRTTHVLNLNWFIRVESNKASLSQIFDWYRADFEQDGSTIVGFINQYRKEPISVKVNLTFYEYDWSLNE